MNIVIIILAVIIFLGMYLAVDYKMGRKRHLAMLKRKEFPFRESEIHVFTHGPDLFDDLFSELEQAKKHIHILFYIIKNDQFSMEFLSILKRKAKAGLEVRLLLDWVGGFKVSKKMVKELKSAGVQFAYCHVPKPPFFFYSLQVRNHRKITVIDGKIGYLGGYNIGKEYIDLDTKLSPWRDYHLKITGEGVQDLQREYLLDWHEATRTDLIHNPFYFPSLHKGPVLHQIAPSEGFFLEETFSKLINLADKSIFIGSPYFIPSKRIFHDLINAIDRGVHITILVPFRSDHLFVKEASYCYLRKLIKKGAHAHQYLKGFYHAKTLVIDNKICDVGTANFDKRSFFLNHELNCYIHNEDFINSVIEVIKTDIKDSHKLTISNLNHVNPIVYLKEAIARPLSYFL